jgi:hypothetical protein
LTVRITAYQSLRQLAADVPVLDLGTRLGWDAATLEDALSWMDVPHPKDGFVYRARHGLGLAFWRRHPASGQGRYQVVLVPPRGRGYSLVAATEDGRVLGVIIVPTDVGSKEVEVELEFVYVSQQRRHEGTANQLADGVIEALVRQAGGRTIVLSAHVMSLGGGRVVDRVMRGLRERGFEVEESVDYEGDRLDI